jgi:hypothetical protein
MGKMKNQAALFFDSPIFLFLKWNYSASAT